MTPEQLREHAKEWDNDGRYSVAEVFRAHADALEEIAALEASYSAARAQRDLEHKAWNDALERLKVAEEALEFYGRTESDPDWPRKQFDLLWVDGGDKARAALAAIREKP